MHSLIFSSIPWLISSQTVTECAGRSAGLKSPGEKCWWHFGLRSFETQFRLNGGRIHQEGNQPHSLHRVLFFFPFLFESVSSWLLVYPQFTCGGEGLDFSAHSCSCF